MKRTLDRVADHFPEYLFEACGLGLFMISACSFGVLLFHPGLAAAQISMPVSRILMGIAMGCTAVAIFVSPLGKRSGGHINPVVTLTYLRLGKIAPVDAVFYAAAHFIGAAAGVLIAWAVFGELLADAAVNFVVTVPGEFGILPAFFAEAAIAFVLMMVVLFASNSKRATHLTPFLAGTLVAIYIAIESPISGMSMNPARTLGSALVAGEWRSWWIYFTAPTIAMLGAAGVFLWTSGPKKVLCAKLDHSGGGRCIFDCRYGELQAKQT